MFRNKWTISGAVLTGIFVLAALFAPWFAPCDPHEINLSEQLAPPSAEHILGQDANGSDILSRLLYGARISLRVGVAVIFLAGGVGIFLGLVSGYYGGWADALLMRLVDILLAFPGLLLAIALVAVLGPNIDNVVLALTLTGWVTFARLVRGQVLSVKERDYVLAAKTSGQTDLRIMLVHILPNVMSPVIVQATFGLAGVIIAESSLSFLGLGAPPGTPSWGAMLSEGKQVLLDAPHVSIFPGLAIMLTVLAFNFLGDGLRDLFDPKSRLSHKK
ncbi:MAG: ABC transporter permease [Gammaproteobacteria bacterium]|nr:ABC transporter permease [Gammaproteobacteria bacterium]